jgi:hypothetical protein
LPTPMMAKRTNLTSFLKTSILLYERNRNISLSF